MFKLGIKKYIVYPPTSIADAHWPLFSITLQQWQVCFSSLSDRRWAVGSVDLPDSLSPGTRLLIWGGLWFPLKSFHTWMIHAVPAALYVNTDTVVASLFAGIRLYLSFCKRSLDTGASVVYFGWILDREQTRTNKEGCVISFLSPGLTSFPLHKHNEKSFGSKCLNCQLSGQKVPYNDLISANQRDSLWIMTHLIVYTSITRKKHKPNLIFSLSPVLKMIHQSLTAVPWRNWTWWTHSWKFNQVNRELENSTTAVKSFPKK